MCTRSWEGTQPGPQLAPWNIHTVWHHAQPTAGKLAGAAAWELTWHQLGGSEQLYCASFVNSNSILILLSLLLFSPQFLSF